MSTGQGRFCPFFNDVDGIFGASSQRRPNSLSSSDTGQDFADGFFIIDKRADGCLQVS